MKLLAVEAITKMDYKEITEYNREKIEQLQKEIVIVKQSVKQQSNQEQVFLKLAKKLEKVLGFGDFTEELLHRLIIRIDVGENQRVTTHYRFRDPY